MLGRRCLAILVVGLMMISSGYCMITSATASNGNQWSQWGGDQRNTGYTGFDAGKNSPSLLWNIIPCGKTNSEEFYNWTATMPVVAQDGTIYVASYDHNITAVYPNGTVKWAIHIPENPHLSPALAPDGRLYIASSTTNSTDGTAFYSFYPNGTQEWRLVLPEQIASQIRVDGNGTIYAALVDGTENSTLAVINGNGTLRWHADVAYDHVNTPVVSDEGIVYLLSDSALYSFDGQGNPAWSFVLDHWENYTTCDPLVTKDGSVVLVSEDAVYKVRENGTLAWSQPVTTFSGGSTFLMYDDATDMTLMLSWNELDAFSEGGELLWSSSNMVSSYRPLLCANQTLVIFNGQEFICLDVSATGMGSIIWKTSRLIVVTGFAGPCGLAMSSGGTFYLTMEYDPSGGQNFHLVALQYQEDRGGGSLYNLLWVVGLGGLLVLSIVVFIFKFKKED